MADLVLPNILYGNDYKTRQTKFTNLTLPSCLTHQFICLNKKVKEKKNLDILNFFIKNFPQTQERIEPGPLSP